MHRRHFLAALGGALVAAPLSRSEAQQNTSAVTNVPMNDGAHKAVTLAPKPNATPLLSADEVKVLEGGLRCQCSCRLDVHTCRTTDMLCVVSPAMHKDVNALVAGGHSAQEIIDAFVDTYGERVRMAPKAEGFNTLAYLAPYIAFGGAGIGVALWIAGNLRKQRAMVAARAENRPIPIHGTSDELERLQRELRDDSR